MKDNPNVEQWLEKIPLDLQKITWKLIAVAPKNIPNAHDFMYHDAVGYSVNDANINCACRIPGQKNSHRKFGSFIHMLLTNWPASWNVFLILRAILLVRGPRNQRKKWISVAPASRGLRRCRA
jgi:hypothetical protein